MRLPQKIVSGFLFGLAVCGVTAAAALLFPIAAPVGSRVLAANQSQGTRRSVLVELFTSEGCSSCPPADALLARLDAQQFVPGARAIVLSEHVTYWNHDGWSDPFSLDSVTDRQQQYGFHFGLDSVYTPQAVIDGEAQVVGSDGPALARAVAKATAAPGVDLNLEDVTWSGNSVQFKVRAGGDSPSLEPATRNARLLAALAEDSAQTSVKGGENAGRTLRHVAVLRVLQEFGKGAGDGRALSLKVPNDLKPGPVRLVVFLADRNSGRVLGVDEKSLAR